MLKLNVEKKLLFKYSCQQRDKWFIKEKKVFKHVKSTYLLWYHTHTCYRSCHPLLYMLYIRSHLRFSLGIFLRLFETKLGQSSIHTFYRTCHQMLALIHMGFPFQGIWLQIWMPLVLFHTHSLDRTQMYPLVSNHKESHLSSSPNTSFLRVINLQSKLIVSFLTLFKICEWIVYIFKYIKFVMI